MSNPQLEIIDLVSFDEQQEDISYARIPNGTGDFEFRTATFETNNDDSISDTDDLGLLTFKLYPNPASDFVTLLTSMDMDNKMNLSIRNAMGQVVHASVNESAQNIKLDLGSLDSGIYFVSLDDQKTGKHGVVKLVVNH